MEWHQKIRLVFFQAILKKLKYASGANVRHAPKQK